jgi:hypothetical protein
MHLQDYHTELRVAEGPLRRIKNVTWPTYLLNELHIQIQFILEESGFLRLQRKGFQKILPYNTKIYPVVFHPYVPFIIGDTEGHKRHAFQRYNNFVLSVNVQHI